MFFQDFAKTVMPPVKPVLELKKRNVQAVKIHFCTMDNVKKNAQKENTVINY